MKNFEKLKDEMIDIIFMRITENSNTNYDCYGNLDDGRTITDKNVVKMAEEIASDIIGIMKEETEKEDQR